MKNELINWLRSFATFKRSEQIGIIVLVIIILIISSINLLLPVFAKPDISEKYSYNVEAVKNFLKEQQRITDSITNEKTLNQLSTGRIGDTLFNFDPNKIPDSLWSILGLSNRQIININNFKKKGGVFNEPGDLKKMYTISEGEYKILEPFITIKTKKITPNKKKYIHTDINTSDSAALVNNLHLNPKIAHTIIKFRKLLGGFYSIEQLKEVYGLSQKTYDEIVSFIIADTSIIEKLDLNNSTFKEFVRHPYFDYETTKKIFDHKESKGNFKSLNELIESGISTDSDFQKQKYYLYIRPL